MAGEARQRFRWSAGCKVHPVRWWIADRNSKENAAEHWDLLVKSRDADSIWLLSAGKQYKLREASCRKISEEVGSIKFDRGLYLGELEGNRGEDNLHITISPRSAEEDDLAVFLSPRWWKGDSVPNEVAVGIAVRAAALVGAHTLVTEQLLSLPRHAIHEFLALVLVWVYFAIFPCGSWRRFFGEWVIRTSIDLALWPPLKKWLRNNVTNRLWNFLCRRVETPLQWASRFCWRHLQYFFVREPPE
eukprot:TRINITY_DN96655_c0_g1_i1.p1 TRINITY_DN96655_c0_g1~~TRINITY_DN96655_c0_g1_i1.p1  ORF type:complete len:245 (-),score=23.27 TRINITY_DN96655_c0_g1_i1:66-800(-)